MSRAELFYSQGQDSRQREIITFRTDKQTREILLGIAREEDETVSDVLRSLIIDRAVMVAIRNEQEQV